MKKSIGGFSGGIKEGKISVPASKGTNNAHTPSQPPIGKPNKGMPSGGMIPSKVGTK